MKTIIIWALIIVILFLVRSLWIKNKRIKYLSHTVEQGCLNIELLFNLMRLEVPTLHLLNQVNIKSLMQSENGLANSYLENFFTTASSDSLGIYLLNLKKNIEDEQKYILLKDCIIKALLRADPAKIALIVAGLLWDEQVSLFTATATRKLTESFILENISEQMFEKFYHELDTELGLHAKQEKISTTASEALKARIILIKRQIFTRFH